MIIVKIKFYNIFIFFSDFFHIFILTYDLNVEYFREFLSLFDFQEDYSACEKAHQV